VNLHFAAGGFQRISLRIGTECAAGKTGIFRLFGIYQLVSLPELIKWRQRHLLARPAPRRDLIEGLQPLQIGFPEARAPPSSQRSLRSAKTSNHPASSRGATTRFIGTRCWLL
jgi:hypothetical protein